MRSQGMRPWPLAAQRGILSSESRQAASAQAGTGVPCGTLAPWAKHEGARVEPIVLVGMMGAGKTTIGRLLAARHHWDFVDADAELEARTGVAIPLIFEMEGEAGFRERETKLLKELLARKNAVIATGGGAVTRAENRQLLHRSGVVVYLDVPLAVLWQRLQEDRHRPLLQVPDPQARLAQLYEERSPWYREVADISIAAGDGRPQAVVRAIEAALAERGWLLPGPFEAQAETSDVLPGLGD